MSFILRSLTAAILLLLFSQSLAPAPHAQASSSQSRQPSVSMTDLKRSVARAIGLPTNEIQLHFIDTVLIVVLTDSKMNSASHSARDNEAGAILSVIAGAVDKASEHKSLATIRIQYIALSAGTARVIDTVEFRKDADGKFQLHQT